mmetsp:Transcript_33744/g.54421  ORF Transcript_33744/g.54421 Transcript_33744/m.54421 type:complete len:86 (-) Transcript_33744:1125-1382(-)
MSSVKQPNVKCQTAKCQVSESPIKITRAFNLNLPSTIDRVPVTIARMAKGKGFGQRKRYWTFSSILMQSRECSWNAKTMCASTLR